MPCHSHLSLYFDIPLYTKPALVIVEVLYFPNQLSVFLSLQQHALKQFLSVLYKCFLNFRRIRALNFHWRLKRIYLLRYLPNYLPTYLPTYHPSPKFLLSTGCQFLPPTNGTFEVQGYYILYIH